MTTLKTERDKLVEDARHQLSEWKRRLDHAQRESGRKLTDLKESAAERAEKLEHARAQLELRLKAASDEVAEGWDSVRDELKSAISSFTQAASGAFDELKK